MIGGRRNKRYEESKNENENLPPIRQTLWCIIRSIESIAPDQTHCIAQNTIANAITRTKSTARHYRWFCFLDDHAGVEFHVIGTPIEFLQPSCDQWIWIYVRKRLMRRQSYELSELIQRAHIPRTTLHN